MIWKVVSVLSFTLCVLGREDAVSEQKVTIYYQKSGTARSLPFLDSIKSENHYQNSRENPSYEFSYKVNDPETRDIKGQHEKKAGDEVTGNYWLIEPNGKKRTVDYQANDDKGFNAQIKYTASKQGGENIGINQRINIEKGDLEKNNDDDIENNVTEANENVEESNVDNSGNEFGTEENNEENQIDNQEDGAENISDVVINIDRTDRDNYRNRNTRVLNKSHRENRTDNNPEKGKRGKLKRNKSRARNPTRIINESNKSNRSEYQNGEGANQEYVKLKEDNNKRQQLRRDKKINNSHNSNNSNRSNEKSSQNITTKEQNSNAVSEVSKQKNISNNDQNSKVSGEGKIHPNIDRNDTPDSEVYEHRVRILHPKTLSSNTKDEKHKR